MTATTEKPRTAGNSAIVSRYGEIGIVAVAAAVLFTGAGNAAPSVSVPGSVASARLRP